MAGVHEPEAQAGRRLRMTGSVAALLVLLTTCLQAPAQQFRADAGTYWEGGLALIAGDQVFERGMLSLRGMLTAVVYLPAATMSTLAGGAGAGFFVLVQNALLIALVGVVLVPALVGRWRVVTPSVVAVSAFVTALVLRGFAPYPLMDLWAAALLLAAVWLVGRGPRGLLVAGVACGVAFNLRPASLIALGLVAAVVVVVLRWRAAWVAVGGLAALVPQVIANAAFGAPAWPWPRDTFALSQLQSEYAAYVVRYDTVSTPENLFPSFYCGPGMAEVASGGPPASAGELVLFFLRTLPDSAVFVLQKVTTALHWPIATPYTTAAPGVNALFALLITAVTVFGLVATWCLRERSGWRRPVQDWVLLALAMGTLASLASSATEARFAVLLVLLGVLGCALVAARRGPGDAAIGSRSMAVTALVVAVVFGVGATGLAHPAEVGIRATPEACAAS